MSDYRTIAENYFRDGTRIHQGDVNNYHNCLNEDKKKCLLDLRVTDPSHDKARIEQSKGGLREDSYCWILENESFKQWKKPESDTRFLWVKGDPGKGKTMLLAGIIDELTNTPGSFGQVTYFFCQETDSRINNATAVLRGLIYMLVKNQESLLMHVWKEYEHAGKQLFLDCNAFTALSRILQAILADAELKEAVLIVDALDECVTDLRLLLDLFVDLSQRKVRWIVSSRNWPEIDVLHGAAQKLVLCLELNEASISQAVKAFIHYRVDSLAKRKPLSDDTRLAIQEYMESNCNETFLWVALACQLIEDPKLPAWKVLTKLKETPAGLDNIYRRMLHYTLDSYCAEDCKQILKLALTVYRPLTLDEMLPLWEPSENTPFDKHTLQQIIKGAGSFLILKDDIVYFIHQSAKDFLVTEAIEELGLDSHLQHSHVFDRCLIALNLSLRRNIYSLDYPGFPIEEVKTPQPDPLAPVRYCSIYWASHFCDSGPEGLSVALTFESSLEYFLREKTLNWIEAVCLMQLLPDALRAIKSLQFHFAETDSCLHPPSERARQDLQALINDVFRMLCYFKPAITAAPLQIYASGLTFCPESFLETVSNERSDAQDEVYKWNTSSLILPPHWSPRIQTVTLPAQYRAVWITFTRDDLIICSWRYDTLTIQRANNAASAELLGRPSDVVLGVYSTDCTRLACLSTKGEIAIWDLERKKLLKTLNIDLYGYLNISSPQRDVALTFTSDSSTLLLACNGRVQLYNTDREVVSQQLDTGETSGVKSHVFSGEGTRLATVEEGTVEIWDLDNNRMIRRCRKLKPIFPAFGPCPMSFSCDGNRLAVVEYDRVIVYDLRNDEYLYIDRHETALDFYIFTAAPVFTRCGTIGVPCSDGTRLWAADGTYLGMLEAQSIESLCFSSDATQIAVIDSELNVVIWDATLLAKTDRDVQQCHLIQDCFMSSNGCELAIVAQNVVSIWDTQSGALTKSVEARDLLAVRLSEDFRWLAWTEYNDNMIRFWDTLEDELVTGIEARHRAARLPFFEDICFSHPGSNLVAIWSLSGEITIWDLLSRSPKPYVLRAHMKVFHEMGDCAQTLVFSSSSSEFFLSHPENGIEVYDTSTGVRTRTFELPRDFSDTAKKLHSLVLSDDGLRIVVQHFVWKRQYIIILDAKTGSCLARVDIDLLEDGFTDLRTHTWYGVLDLLDKRLMERRTSEFGDDRFRIVHSVESPNNWWIVCGDRRIVWIPHEFRTKYRPKVARNTVVFRNDRGGVIWLRFL